MAMEISRRSFLKGSAAAAVSSILLGSTSIAFADEQKEEAPAKSWRTAPDPIPESEIVDTLEADVVVLGAGHAGSCCARAAAENGATVILAEKADEAVYMVFGTEFGHLNSEYTTKTFGYPAVDEGEFFSDYMLRNMYRCNPALVRTYTQQSGKTLDWLIDNMTDELKAAISTESFPQPKYYTGEQQGQKSWPTMVDLGDTAAVHKGDIAKMLSCNDANKMLWGTSAEQLVMEGGKVVGAIVKNKDGYIRLNAKKGVVVATGGFGANAEMCNDIYRNLIDVFPEDVRDKADASFMMSGRDGKGHQLCVWAGAAWEPDEPASMVMHPAGQNPFNSPKGAFSTVWLNGEGRRYIAEGGDFQLSSVAGRYGKANDDASFTVMCVFDSSLLEDLQYQQNGHATSGINDAVNGETYAANMKDLMQKCIDSGDEGIDLSMMSPMIVYSGETLEQLADRMGLTGDVKANFLDEIARYNEFCKNGVDTDFYKDPSLLLPIEDAPYFGYVSQQKLNVCLTTLSGVWTDDNQCVLSDETHEPIEGLYATGNVCGRRFIGQYSTSIAGESVGMACTLGKALGEHLASL